MTKNRLNLTLALVCFACIGFSQNRVPQATKEVESEKKPIKVSLLSNYYEQDGEHGATNGGKGSQDLYSYTQEGSIFLPVSKRVGVKLSGGVDYFTAASYLDIDKYKTSASSGNSGVSVDETRTYGGIGIDFSNKNQTKTMSPYVGFSKEYDVNSLTLGYSHSLINPTSGSVLSFKLNSIMDTWMLIYPGEFRNTNDEYDAGTSASDKGTKINPNAIPIVNSGDTKTKDGKTYGIDNRYSNAIGANYAFNINKKMNALIGVDAIFQKGLLNTPFYRVYFKDGVIDEYSKTVAIEKLPRLRHKLAIYGRFNWFLNKFVVLRTSLRLYKDDWGINSATFDLTVPVKVTRAVTISPFVKVHAQTASDYFAGYGRHLLTDQYYTSDFDLSQLQSQKIGGTLRLVPFHKFLNVKSLDLRYAHYKRSDGLTGNSITAELSFEF
ncbi:uncharacterized protein DUF3570 [Arcicella aurantiaca]|uniref:Uncharacterized protein DUF3570 n=1 Tax=Arcicella aurantiaca TaxID=591202 RepID=A0A316DSB2_9BACT|nr:DUF3570 domain-containing protein [Arcicella aurantiaca]PWK20069.1 uncharacterized protein DUF3570 [Arcicella aurantiaca]